MHGAGRPEPAGLTLEMSCSIIDHDAEESAGRPGRPPLGIRGPRRRILLRPRAIAAQDGGFSLEVDPGSYHLTAHRGAEAGAQGAPISVAAGQTVRGIVLQLGAASTIAGTVFAQSSGKPISGATIAVTAMGTTSVVGTAVSDAAGECFGPGRRALALDGA